MPWSLPPDALHHTRCPKANPSGGFLSRIASTEMHTLFSCARALEMAPGAIARRLADRREHMFSLAGQVPLALRSASSTESDEQVYATHSFTALFNIRSQERKALLVDGICL